MNREQLIKVLSDYAEMILEVLDADAQQCAAWRARGAEATAAFADARVGRPLPASFADAHASLTAPAPGGVRVLRQALGPLALPGSRDPDPTPGGSADHAGYVPADWELGGAHCGRCGALDHITRECRSPE